MCKSSKGFFPSDIFSRGHATLHLAMSVGKLVRRSVTFLNSKRFLHYCSCPTVRDWIRPCFMLTQVDFIFSFHLFLLLIGETPGAVVSNVTLPSRNSKLYRSSLVLFTSQGNCLPIQKCLEIYAHDFKVLSCKN